MPVHNPHFIWKIERKEGLPGETQAEIAQRMEEIAQSIGAGLAKTEIFYDENLVGARISVSLTSAMRASAQAEARRLSGQGLSGLVARFLFFVKGFDEQARGQVIDNIAERLLHEKSSRILESIRQRLAAALSQSSLHHTLKAHLTQPD